MDRTIIIAEIGECFNGDMNQAKNLIQVAAEAGCNYAKFQTLDQEGISPDDPERDWFLSIALDESAIQQLMTWCREFGIGFLCSPEKKKNAETLYSLGCKEVKIASTCAWDKDLVSYVATSFPTVFLSTGMSSLAEIDEIMNQLSSQQAVYLLHCISEYPTGPLLEERGLQALKAEDVRLRMMDILKDRYPHALVGYSDHTVEITAPIAAVARGAKVIEKHITLDRQMPVRQYLEGKKYLGTDHVLSLEPGELAQMVKAIRDVEKMLEPDTWERTKGEQLLMNFLKGRFSWEED